MPLDSIAIMLVMTAAIMHATWNALVKSAGNKWYMFGSIFFIGSIVSAVIAIFTPLPAEESWGYLLLSSFIHYGYYAFLLKSYKFGDLSKVYPIARGSAPLLVAVGGYFFAGEALSTEAYLAIILSSLGIMALAFEKGLPRGADKKPLIYALITGLFISSYTIVDALGVRASGNPISYIVWLFALEGIPFVIWFAVKHKVMIPYMRGEIKLVLVGAFASHMAYALVISALALSSMAGVSALRETSVIIAAIIGAVILKEGFGKWRITAASL
ncbi:MAG: EamA family transporter, partial [Alphaproteobacteria bacterium]|nr:EamA family transporter [Alphaproteobacteria bacterium]